MTNCNVMFYIKTNNPDPYGTLDYEITPKNDTWQRASDGMTGKDLSYWSSEKDCIRTIYDDINYASYATRCPVQSYYQFRGVKGGYLTILQFSKAEKKTITFYETTNGQKRYITI